MSYLYPHPNPPPPAGEGKRLVLLPLAGEGRVGVKQQGFTLLEVLVAVMIFSFIAVASFQLLDSVIDSQDATEIQAQRLQALQRAFFIMEQDFEQIVDRPIRDPYGDPRDDATHLVVKQEDTLVEFTRTGWRNPAHYARSELQRVAYGWVEEGEKKAEETAQTNKIKGELHRWYWRVLDRDIESEKITQVLLLGAEEVQLRFLDDELEWHETWPLTDPAEDSIESVDLPRAIEVSFNYEGVGEIKRLFRLRY